MSSSGYMLLAMVLVAVTLIVGGFVALLAPDLAGRL